MNGNIMDAPPDVDRHFNQGQQILLLQITVLYDIQCCQCRLWHASSPPYGQCWFPPLNGFPNAIIPSETSVLWLRDCEQCLKSSLFAWNMKNEGNSFLCSVWPQKNIGRGQNWEAGQDIEVPYSLAWQYLGLKCTQPSTYSRQGLHRPVPQSQSLGRRGHTRCEEEGRVIIQFLKVVYTVLTEQYLMFYHGYFVRQIQFLSVPLGHRTFSLSLSD